MFRLIALLLVTVCSITCAQEVSVVRRVVDAHAEFEVHAEVRARTSVAVAWQVLTDYDRLASFVPDLQSSRRLPWAEAGTGEYLVEQHATARLLFLRQPIELVLQVREQPMSIIDMTLQSGNMRKYQARWELQPLSTRPDQPDQQVLLRYSGLVAPDFYVPGLFASALMRRDLTAMLKAVAAEMEGRTAAATAATTAATTPAAQGSPP